MRAIVFYLRIDNHVIRWYRSEINTTFECHTALRARGFAYAVSGELSIIGPRKNLS